MSNPTPRKPWWRRWFGSRSERAAGRYLKRCGYRILARNYRCPLGEIDLVAWDGRCIVFVEVRSTEKADFEGPLASVDADKQQRMERLAVAFLKRYRLLGRSARFDVIAVSWPSNVRTPTVQHIANAFETAGKFQPYS